MLILAPCVFRSVLVTHGGLVRIWEREADLPAAGHQREDAGVGDDIPGQRQSDVLIGPEEETDGS